MESSTRFDSRGAALALLCMQRHSWEQGVTMQAFLETGETETVIRLAAEAVNRRLPDGRVAVMGDVNGATDPCCAGEALLSAARETGDKLFYDAFEGLKTWALTGAPRNADGIVYHLVNAPQFWVDSLYMLPPFLAAAGCREEAVKQVEGYERALFDSRAGLFSHQWDDGAKRFIRAAHWGVGNGWALAAYARLCDLIPESAERFAKSARSLIDALLKYMRPDGLFHDVVDDENTFVEANLSQIICYAICRGVRRGWLGSEYGAFARRLYAAAMKNVNAYGVIENVCGAPSFDKAGEAPEAQAFLLMMNAEYSRLY